VGGKEAGGLCGRGSGFCPPEIAVGRARLFLLKGAVRAASEGGTTTARRRSGLFKRRLYRQGAIRLVDGNIGNLEGAGRGWKGNSFERLWLPSCGGPVTPGGSRAMIARREAKAVKVLISIVLQGTNHATL